MSAFKGKLGSYATTTFEMRNFALLLKHSQLL